VDEKVKLGREDIYLQLEDFKGAFIQASRGLGSCLDNVELRLIGLSNNPQAPATAPPNIRCTSNAWAGTLGEVADNMSRQPPKPIYVGDDLFEEVTTRIKTRVNELEQKLSGALARAIRFAGLGFQTIAESNAWLETSLQKHQSGLIVDAHMVFEHIYHAIKGNDTIAIMEKLYKSKFSASPIAWL
jgi:hypothetical protein